MSIQKYTKPTDAEIRDYISGTLCDLACPYNSFLCHDGGACDILQKYQTGELGFAKINDQVVRLF